MAKRTAATTPDADPMPHHPHLPTPCLLAFALLFEFGGCFSEDPSPGSWEPHEDAGEQDMGPAAQQDASDQLRDTEPDVAFEEDGSGGSEHDGGSPEGFCSTRPDGSWCQADTLVSCRGGQIQAQEECDLGCLAVPGGRSHRCREAEDAFCESKPDGAWCDGDELVTCLAGALLDRETCLHGCEPIPGGQDDRCRQEGQDEFCQGKADGLWCDGDDLVRCQGGVLVARAHCPEGCEPMAAGVDDRCRQEGPGDFCQGKANGLWCDGDDLVRCRDDEVVERSRCDQGCEPMAAGVNDRCRQEGPGDFCEGKMNGHWCDGDDLVLCRDGRVAERTPCEHGCRSMPLGTPDRCEDPGGGEFCEELPPHASPDPPSEDCNRMDWHLSPDGFYLVSRFGTDNDQTTWGHTTSCGWLQSHYDAHGCRHDGNLPGCLDGDHEIPWVRGDVDYSFDDMIRTVDNNMNGDVPRPDYFYVAGAQRFGCGATLRVSRVDNARCVVAYVEDGGPGARYEYADRGGRRILDSSPAVVRYLQVQQLGWANSDLMYVEWGLPDDVPGHACTPCESTPARAGTEDWRSLFDLNHMMPFVCEH